MTSLSTGMVVFLHNQSYAPADQDRINVETGKETNIGIKRTFTYNQAAPYSECVDLGSFRSDLYDFMKTSQYAYRQTDCFDLCLQKQIIQACKCYFTKYTMFRQSQACLNKTQLTCIETVTSEFVVDDCVSECPLECDSVRYDYDLSTLVAPNEKLYNVFKNDPDVYYGLQAGYNINLSTYEQFQKYFLMLNIYYPYLQYTKIEETPKTSQIDLLSQIGGSLGMFLGFSLFHFVEIAEILFLIVYTFLY